MAYSKKISFFHIFEILGENKTPCRKKAEQLATRVEREKLFLLSDGTIDRIIEYTFEDGSNLYEYQGDWDVGETPFGARAISTISSVLDTLNPTELADAVGCYFECFESGFGKKAFLEHRDSLLILARDILIYLGDEPKTK